MWYRCGESPSRGCTEKSPNGQKHHRTKAPNDKNQSRQNPQKRQYFSTPTSKVYNPISGHVITITSGMDNQHHVGTQRKAPMDKSTIGQKLQRAKIKADKTPKIFNILVPQKIKMYNPISDMWSSYTCVDNQHHMGAQRKVTMDKIIIGQKNQRIKIKEDKTPKRDNILVRQQSRCTISFLVMWSCDTDVENHHHMSAQRKAPMDKSTIGQKLQMIKIKEDKTPKRGNILVRQQSRCTIPFLVMWSRSQQVWTINITWVHIEKPKWTKAR